MPLEFFVLGWPWHLHMISGTGWPSKAYPIAGFSTLYIGRFPNSLRSWYHPSTNPGVDSEYLPNNGISPEIPSFAKVSLARPNGDRPLPLYLRYRLDLGSQTIANRSPPTPLLTGFTHRCTAILEDIQTHLRCQRMACRHHSMTREDLRSRSTIPAR